MNNDENIQAAATAPQVQQEQDPDDVQSDENEDGTPLNVIPDISFG